LGLLPENLITAHFSNADSAFPPKVAKWQQFIRAVPYHKYTEDSPVCRIEFNIPEDLQPTVSFYYYLENFYQNHRRYVGSFNAKQLLGEPVDGNTINSSTCDPITYDAANKTGRIVYPCGIVANSMFNDTFTSPLWLNVKNASSPEGQVYQMSNNSGITWPGLRDLYGPTRYNYTQIVPPPNWEKRYRGGYSEEQPPPNLQELESFQNWMMLAASPNFYKLYQRNDKDPMIAGTYQIEIVSNFDTTKYNGRKSFVITTLSPMGSRNIWPGIIFLIVGGICLLLDIYFILSFFLWKPRKLGDPSYLSWNQPQAPAPAHAASAS